MDLIERQAAIEVVKHAWAKGLEPTQYLEELPAVETEVLKCKDCYWWTKQSDSLQGRCDRYGFYPTGYWYCAAARERRTE